MNPSLYNVALDCVAKAAIHSKGRYQCRRRGGGDGGGQDMQADGGGGGQRHVGSRAGSSRVCMSACVRCARVQHVLYKMPGFGPQRRHTVTHVTR